MCQVWSWKTSGRWVRCSIDTGSRWRRLFGKPSRAGGLRAECGRPVVELQAVVRSLASTPVGFVSMDVLRERVEVLIREDGGRVVLVRDLLADGEAVEAERRLALAAAAPAGYVPVHGHGRGGHLLIGDLAVAPWTLHAVLTEKGLGSDALYLPICEIASIGFVQALATMQNSRAAGSTTFTWVDPKTGTTVATSLVVVCFGSGPRRGRRMVTSQCSIRGARGRWVLWVRFRPGRVRRCRSGLRWPGWRGGAGARRLRGPPVLSPVPQLSWGLASHGTTRVVGSAVMGMSGWAWRLIRSWSGDVGARGGVGRS